MTHTILAELIRNGENSGVEFKRDDIPPERLASRMAALLNLDGGHILLGVEDDASVTGLTRTPARAEEWVMQVARDLLRPAAIPYWETIEWEPGLTVGVISLPGDSPDKPYKAKRGNAWVTQIRVGSTTRDATREEEQRLYQQSGHIRYDLKPVPGSIFQDLSLPRLIQYFRDFRRQEVPDAENEVEWRTLLLNTDFMVEDRGTAIPTAGAMVLFSPRANRFLPQTGITAVCYPGREKDYNAVERQAIKGAAVAHFAASGEVLENGVIDQALRFVRENTKTGETIDESGVRQARFAYSMDAVRETVVNAIAHRDYTIHGTDIELSIYGDRLEVISPGRLPNTVTVEKMRAGYRASRNELIKEVLRDYRYVEATGLGVPRKIIAGMRSHNGTEAELIEDDDRFIVRLWRA